MKRIPFFKLFVLSIAFLTSLPSVAEDCAILLHGLARDSSSMDLMNEALTRANYRVININYPSTTNTIEQLAESVLPLAIQQCDNTHSIHFVTHSMGGILVRYYLKHHPINNMGKVVMLGPPNQGSEAVDKLGDWKIFDWINGPAGKQLGTDKNSLPISLGEVHFKLGIIAGTRSIDPLCSALIPGNDDGKVSVERTKLISMSDHIILPVTHTFMMRNKYVIKQVLFFLSHGRFNHVKSSK